MKPQNNKKKLFVVGGEFAYGEYLPWLVEMGFQVTDNLDEAGTVFFAGGADVSPELYNEEKGRFTFTSPQRDKYELEVFNKSQDKYKIGVCRGAQFLGVMAGYKLVQDSEHPGLHKITTYDGLEFPTSSSHHQQVLLQPSGKLDKPLNYKLIAWANKLSPYHRNGKNQSYNFPNSYKETEIVSFSNRSLGIQNHPEYLNMNHPSVKYCQKLVEQLLNDKLN